MFKILSLSLIGVLTLMMGGSSSSSNLNTIPQQVKLPQQQISYEEVASRAHKILDSKLAALDQANTAFKVVDERRKDNKLRNSASFTYRISDKLDDLKELEDLRTQITKAKQDIAVCHKLNWRVHQIRPREQVSSWWSNKPCMYQERTYVENKDSRNYKKTLLDYLQDLVEFGLEGSDFINSNPDTIGFHEYDSKYPSYYTKNLELYKTVELTEPDGFYRMNYAVYKMALEEFGPTKTTRKTDLRVIYEQTSKIKIKVF